MYEAIGELLPLAVAVSISPLPIIAMIVLLTSSHARTSAPAFLVGWMVAIASALTGFAWLSDLGLGGGAGRIASATRLIVGILMLLLACKEWRSRPRSGEKAQLPHWLAAVENMSPLAACGLGFGIYAVNPKNLTVGIAAGVSFGSTLLTFEAAAAVGLLYVLVAASTVWAPVVACLLAEKRVRPWLDETQEWLNQHNAALMAVLLLVIAAMMIGKGIAGLGA